MTINPLDIAFLKGRTGVSSRTGTLAADTQKIVDDAVALYKAVVALALDGEKLGTYREIDGKLQITPLDLQARRLEYALENADIPDISKQQVETSFQRFIEDQRRHALKSNDGAARSR